jgi:protein-disulfide isomerase
MRIFGSGLQAIGRRLTRLRVYRPPFHRATCRDPRRRAQSFAARVAFALALACGATAPICVGASPAAKPAAIDPRLGPPFEVRDRPSLGSDQAPIVVVEFGSYKCSHCEEFHQRVFPELKDRYITPGKVQWFMVPASGDSADASGHIFAIGRCVHRQAKFWDTLDYLMTISNKPPSFLDDLVAKNAAIDSGELAFCLQDRGVRTQVSKDFDEYRALKVQGTPTFFIRKLQPDGSRTETIVRGYESVEYFERIFAELAKTP